MSFSKKYTADIIVQGIINPNSILQSNGEVNEYRRAFYLGQGGSYRDATWNKEKHVHNCCQSKVAWRHKTSCSTIKSTDDLSDLKDLD